MNYIVPEFEIVRNARRCINVWSSALTVFTILTKTAKPCWQTTANASPVTAV